MLGASRPSVRSRCDRQIGRKAELVTEEDAGDGMIISNARPRWWGWVYYNGRHGERMAGEGGKSVFYAVL
jgi:hypothetical protein